MIKHLEVKTYEYCGINVTVKIDYDNNSISLIERVRGIIAGNAMPFAIKNWVFAERGLEFMPAWIQILDAMQYAIKEATKELEDYKEAKLKEKSEDVMNALDIATDIIKNKNAKRNKSRKS